MPELAGAGRAAGKNDLEHGSQNHNNIKCPYHAMPEPPATWLLRPVGFDTLAVRIWIETSEALRPGEAAAALWLSLVTLSLVAPVLSYRGAQRRPA